MSSLFSTRRLKGGPWCTIARCWNRWFVKCLSPRSVLSNIFSMGTGVYFTQPYPKAFTTQVKECLKWEGTARPFEHKIWMAVLRAWPWFFDVHSHGKILQVVTEQEGARGRSIYLYDKDLPHREARAASRLRWVLCQNNETKGCLVKASTQLFYQPGSAVISLVFLGVSSSFLAGCKPGTASPPAWWCIGLGILDYTHVVSNSVIERVQAQPHWLPSGCWQVVSGKKRQYSLLLKVLPALLVLQVIHGECGWKSMRIGQLRESGAGIRKVRESSFWEFARCSWRKLRPLVSFSHKVNSHVW